MITRFDIKNSLARLIFDYKYSLILLMTMSLGFGVSLFLFSQIYVRNYSVLPFEDAERLVYASRYEHGYVRTNGGLHSYDVHYFADNQTTLDDLVAYENRSFTLATSSFTEQVGGAATSSNLFKLAGVRPLVGRHFLPSDDNVESPPVAVLSYSLWQRLFQEDESAVGTEAKIDGVPVTVIGVMPKGFEFPLSHQLWLSYLPPEMATPDSAGWNGLIGKLKTGVDLEQADDQFKKLAKDIENNYPQRYAGKSVAVQYYTKASAAPISLLVSIMTVVALSVLAMSFLSVVSLIIVRMLENTKQIAIKKALGVPPRHIIAGPLIESFVLCALAGLLGVYFSYLGLEISKGYITSNQDPFWWQLTMGEHIWIAAFLVTIFAWMVTGLLPISLALKRLNLATLAGGRKGGSGSKVGPVMHSFVSLQVSCAFVLMVFTGVCLASVYEILNADYGVNSDNVLSAWVQPAESLYPELADRIEYFERLGQAASSPPEVEAIAFSGALPGSYGYLSTYNSVQHELAVDGAYPQVMETPISANFFELFDVFLLQGRPFIAADDAASEPVAIVSEKLAQKISPDSSAIGKKLHLNPDNEGPLLTIVGVAPNLIFGPPVSLHEVDLDTLYRPMTQIMPSWTGMSMAAKVKGSLSDAEGYLLKVAREVDSQVALTGLGPYEEILARNAGNFLSLVYNFMPATIIAFLMSALGIYAIASRIVLQRTNDIGIMKAVGLTDFQINRAFMLGTVKKLVIGLLIGIVLFGAFIPKIISQLVVLEYGTLAIIAIIVSLILASVVLLASYLPLLKMRKLTPQAAINA